MDQTRSLYEFEQLKNSLAADLSELITVLERFDLLTEQKSKSSGSGLQDMNLTLTEIISEQIKLLLGGTFKILVLGEFSTGKSTFLNALLKEKILPVAVRPTTATINQIKYSPNKRVILNYYGKLDDCGNEITEGIKKEISVDELVTYTTALTEEGHNNSKEIKIVEVHYPIEYCKNSVEILDTPGFASINENHDKITLNYLPNGNACIVLLNPGQPLSKSERHYLRIIRKYISKVFFVINKINLLEEDERKEALEYISDQLKGELNTGNPVKLYPLNAKLAASGDWDKSNFKDFIAAMEEFLTSEEKAKEMIASPAFNALNGITITKAQLKLIRAGLKFSPEEFDKRIQENIPKLEKIRRRQKDLIQFINDREELFLIKADIILNDTFKNLLAQTSAFILNWSGELDEIQKAFQEMLKEKCMEVNSEITNQIQSEVNYVINEVSTRFKDFKDDIDEYTTKVTGSLQVQSGVLSINNMNTENVIEEIAIQMGGALGFGWLAAMVLVGPLGWILAAGGNILFQSFRAASKAKKQLIKIEQEVNSQLKDELNKSVPVIKQNIQNNMLDIKHYTDNQMNLLLTSVEHIIKDIKEARKTEEAKILKKLAQYSEIDTQLTKLETRIRTKYLVINK